MVKVYCTYLGPIMVLSFASFFSFFIEPFSDGAISSLWAGVETSFSMVFLTYQVLFILNLGCWFLSSFSNIDIKIDSATISQIDAQLFVKASIQIIFIQQEMKNCWKTY